MIDLLIPCVLLAPVLIHSAAGAAAPGLYQNALLVVSLVAGGAHVLQPVTGPSVLKLQVLLAVPGPHTLGCRWSGQVQQLQH